jgi:signal transduction histidine kinase
MAWPRLGTVLLVGAVAALLERRWRRLEAERDSERARLANRLITAEQDERRRLSVVLHDGPLQSLSGAALMQDAALTAIREGRPDEAADLLSGALQRERAIIRELRDLSFAIEPVVLRDTSLEAAVQQLAAQLGQARQIEFEVDVAAAAGLGEKAQVALYQVIREAFDQAASRKPSRVRLTIAETERGGYTTLIRDDGHTERRRASADALEERAHVLGARVTVETDDAGTAVSVAIPAHASLR